MKNIILFALIMIANATVQAAPSKFNGCEKKDFKEVSWGSGVIFNSECTKAYVLPPKFGSMTIHSMSPTGYVADECTGYRLSQNSANNTLESFNMATKVINSLYNRLGQLSDYSDQGLTPVGMSYIEMLEEMSKISDLISSQNKVITNMKDKAVAQKKQYAYSEGGVAKFFMESNYNELIKAYKEANPSYDFERMPLDQSYISVSDKDYSNEALNPTLSAVLSITSDDFGPMPTLSPSGLSNETSETSQNSALPGTIFTDGTSGSAVLSILGICPIIDEYGIELNNISISELPQLHASVIYQYQVQVNRKHKVEFNLHQLAKRVEEMKSRGGFLSRKNIHKLTEKTEHESWIKITSTSDDTRFEFNDEYTKSVVQEHMADFLKNIAHVRFAEPGTFPKAGLPDGKNGADISAEAIGKCPHMYCQVGSYALKIVSGTFGSKTALSEYLKTEDAWTVREVDEQKMVPMVGSYTFR